MTMRAIPLAAHHVDRRQVADEGDVDHPLEQRRLRAEPDIHGPVRHPGRIGDGGERGGPVAVPDEQLVRSAHDALLVLGDAGGPQAGGLDSLRHAMQYNCNLSV